jgi:hypothetical protein
MYGLAGSASTWNGFKIYPQGLATYSDDVLVAHAMEWANQDLSTPTLLMTLFDVWVLKSDSLKTWKNIASWVPIDHQPTPPDVLAWCERDNVKPIAMSKFGSRMLDVAGVEHLYVPHAIEPVFPANRVGDFGKRQEDDWPRVHGLGRRQIRCVNGRDKQR